MVSKIDWRIATSKQIEAKICQRLEKIRLSRNITQAQLAKDAGVSQRTIGRLENGQGVTLDTLIRIMIAFRMQENFELLLPDMDVSPLERIERIKLKRVRKRARPKKKVVKRASGWKWGDEL
jgi:transcriptional regulator with XRE-family HTH domain